MNRSQMHLEFGLQSDLFWDPLNDAAVEASAGSGFSFFEIWGHPPWFDIHSAAMAAEVRRMVERHGMWIRSIHAPCEGAWDISSEDETVRKDSIREVIMSMERCREMGGHIAVVHPGRAISSVGEEAVAEADRRIDKSIASFREIGKAAKDHGIRVAVENQWANEVGAKETQFRRLLDALDPGAFGICFDSSHANITPGTFEMFQRITHPIIATHLSDNHGVYDEHKPPFTARVDWDRVMRLILKNGFTGPWLLEITNGGNDPFEVLSVLRHSLEKLRSMVLRVENFS